MKNLGIVIAVSDYNSSLSSLPACKSDGNAVATILETDSRFEDILVIDSQTSSRNVKKKLVDFFTKHKKSETSEPIGDVFFYFSGHGDFSENEFFYLLSDYDGTRRKQTSLENSELDNLVRNLDPENFVKVVDACHSGVTYIKDARDIESYVKKSIHSFRKLYFMFSSQLNQFSYQDRALSYFTKSFIQAISETESGTLRYKDIVDHISDQFSDNGDQTPFFVIQADFTEVFCDVSDPLRDALRKFLPAKDEAASKATHDISLQSIIDRVREEAKLYCTESETYETLITIFKRIQKNVINNDLGELYEFEASEKDAASIPSPATIARRLRGNASEKEFFVTIQEETLDTDSYDKERYLKSFLRDYIVHSNLDQNLFVSNLIRPESTLKQQLRDLLISKNDYESPYFHLSRHWHSVVTGFKTTVDMPYRCIQMSAERRYPNIENLACFLVPVISKTKLLLFWANCIYNDVGWTERKLGDCSWENEEIFLKDTQSIFDLVDRVTDNFHKFARERVASHWTVAQPSDDFVNVSEDQSRQRLIPGNLHQLKPIETNPQDTETDDTPSSSESQERSNW